MLTCSQPESTPTSSRLADQFEATPLDRRTLAGRFREADRHRADAYVRYGVDSERRMQILARFNAWADEIDPHGTGR